MTTLPVAQRVCDTFRSQIIEALERASWVEDMPNGLNLLKPFRMWSSISKEKKTL